MTTDLQLPTRLEGYKCRYCIKKTIYRHSPHVPGGYKYEEGLPSSSCPGGYTKAGISRSIHRKHSPHIRRAIVIILPCGSLRPTLPARPEGYIQLPLRKVSLLHSPHVRGAKRTQCPICKKHTHYPRDQGS